MEGDTRIQGYSAPNGVQITEAFRVGELLGTPAYRPEMDTEVDMHKVYFYTSEALDWPVETAQVLGAVGRFALVAYTPRNWKVKSLDPDIMIALDSSVEAQAFHIIMGEFQAARRDTELDPGRWRRVVKAVAVTKLAPVLAGLQPSYDEADFVVRWAWMVFSKGITCSDGITRTRQHRFVDPRDSINLLPVG